MQMTSVRDDFSTTIKVLVPTGRNLYQPLGGVMAARKSPLRAVEKNETAPERTAPMSITDAAESGEQLELLVALRRRVAITVEDPNCPPRDLAALSRRLQELGKEIEAIKLKVRQEAEEDGGVTADEDWDAEAI